MPPISNDDLKWLLELLEQEQLAEIEIITADGAVLVKAAGATVAAFPAQQQLAASAAAPAVREIEAGERLLAPMGGIFYRASSPEAPPYAELGDEVQIGDTVALIEAMKLYNEVTSHVHGRIIRFLVDDEAAVEADQPLVLIERTTQ